MTRNEMIFKRKSCRSFTGALVDAETIETIKAFPMKPLYPEIKVHWDIVPRNQVKCIFPGWHMNKAHWLSVALDGTVEDEKIKFLVDMSYELTK